ncbi:MAG: type II toxin-antitoxin system PemK/MazF family toxin [Nanoarchaeota archaeon]
MKIKRGEIILAKLELVIGREQGGIRPVLIIQNDESNEFSPTTIIAPITSKVYSKTFPQNVEIEPNESKLKKSSTILLNQIRTIDKRRIIRKLGILNNEILNKVDLAIKVSLGLN